MELRVHRGVGSIDPTQWDALVGDGSPFLEWTWLAGLEATGCVGERTGWLSQPLGVWEDGTLIGACPLYVKDHSQGEFVFDHGWARAAAQAGMTYYPKLLAGVPFTPVAGRRVLARPGREAAAVAVVRAALEATCREQGFSSTHVNFCTPAEVDAFVAAGWLHRTGFQYHWRNDGFASFDDYLASLRSKRRNQVRREQRELAAAGVVVTAHRGDALPDDLGPAALYRLYRSTVDTNPWGQRYLTGAFFEHLVARWPERLVVIVARQHGRVIAGTVNVVKGDTFYGRYWGCHSPLRHLHFNVCYYAGIEYCVRERLAWFHPGAGGEHKQPRGFDAVTTHSVHWLQDRRLRDAVRRFLDEERAAVAGHVAWLGDQTALKRGPGSGEPAS